MKILQKTHIWLAGLLDRFVIWCGYCKHDWQEFTADVTYDKSRECLKCRTRQKWAGYWKTI